jgi:SAM-dependent methyltransferase
LSTPPVVLARPKDDPALSRVHSIDLRLLGLTRKSTGARLLDVGCGAGRHELAARELPVTVAACDLDTGALNDGRFFMQEAEGEPEGQAHWLKASGLRLPFEDDSFDAAICSETLEHIPEDMDVLRELHRTAKSGGRLAISIPAFWPELALWAISWTITHTPGGHVRIYERDQLLEKLRMSGWRPYAVRYRHAFESVYWLLGALLGGGKPPAAPARAWRRLINGDPQKLIDRLERSVARGLAKSIVVYATAA